MEGREEGVRPGKRRGQQDRQQGHAARVQDKGHGQGERDVHSEEAIRHEIFQPAGGVFNIHGYLFLGELQVEERAGIMLGYFNDVGEVHGLHTEDVPKALTDNARGGNNGVADAVVMQSSHVHIGVIAAMCVIVSLLLCCCMCKVRRRRKDANDKGGTRRNP